MPVSEQYLVEVGPVLAQRHAELVARYEEMTRRTDPGLVMQKAALHCGDELLAALFRQVGFGGRVDPVTLCPWGSCEHELAEHEVPWCIECGRPLDENNRPEDSELCACVNRIVWRMALRVLDEHEARPAAG